MFLTNLLKYNTFKRLTAVVLGLVLLCSSLLSGCTSEAFNLYFGIDEMPKNIDPQKAQSYGELLAVRNCFRGLYKQDKNGDPIPDLAEDTIISDDGLTYTFKLKNAQWRDETAVTADDFLFAIERACDPVTNAPSSHLLTNIIGVPERLSGDSNASLGVTAIDSKTLKIRLIKPDKTFLSKLTAAVFMPCNREFFENTGGKYGLNRNNILTNGIYSPSQWTENRHLRLTLNEENGTNPKNVYLTVSSTGKNNIQRIKDKEIGMTVDSVNDYTGINENEFIINTLYQKNYALVFNKNTEVGGNETLTSAFAKAIHREYFSINMSQRFKNSDCVLPSDSLVLTKTSNSIVAPEYGFELDTEQARADFLEAVKQLKNNKLPNISVLTVDNTEVKSVLTDIISGWQNYLGAYMNIKTVSSEQALLDEVKSGSYTIAMIPLSGSASDVLSLFADDATGLYISNEEYNKEFHKLFDTDDEDTAVDAINSCLNVLSKESAVIPIISVPTAFVYTSSYNDVYFSRLDGTIDFSIIYKNK